MANRTKKAIARATQELLRDKPINKITVKEITDRCELTRNSFYYHFADIYDVVNWIFENEIEEFIKNYAEDDTYEKGLVSGLNFLYENKEMIQHIYSTMQSDNVNRYIGRLIDNGIMKIISTISTDHEISEEARKVIVIFYKSAFLGVIHDWVVNDMHVPPEALAVLCDEIFRATVGPALDGSQRSLEMLKFV